MISIQAKDIKKNYGSEVILTKVTFSLNYGDKAGLVGPNGAGKTTLFRCLIGEERADGGKTILGSGMNLGFVEQDVKFATEATLEETLISSFQHIIEMRNKLKQLEEEMTAQSEDFKALEKTMAKYSSLTEEYEQADGYGIEAKVRQVSSGLGFEQADLKKRVELFSGGQKTRIKLGKLLLQEPTVLLLDEPTNHLDHEAVEWLENFLRAYKGTVLVISHDRYFLDQFTNKILELEFGKINAFNGNYTRYRQQKSELEAQQLKVFDKQQQHIAKTEEYINRYRAGVKSKQARGRQKQLEKLELVDKPMAASTLNPFEFDINQASGQRVVELKDIGHSFEGEKYLFQGVTGLLRQGEKLGIVGPNGAGKTTLLKIIMDKLQPTKGEVVHGSRVDFGYYSQQQEDLTETNTIIQEVVKKTELTEYQAQDVLGRFLFSGEDVFKLVSELSGGEKSRLCLLKLFLSKANTLVLDEPTNHLDIPAKEVLERALQDFAGTVIMISHDRYFLDQITDKIWEIKDERFVEYLGNYTDYRWKKQQLLELKEKELAEVKAREAEKGKLNQKKEKEKQKKARAEKKQQSQLEEEISDLESKLNAIGEELAQPETYSDPDKARELNLRYKDLENEIAEKYSQWEELIE
ncbi:ATP-binding cassette subfamily F protein 3 [Desulfitispora alkaliphila]|uniref:ABC-F family ATP-binding cassette domain-containing protein n=1 Tax=Desulfitispora alkaliphila TaxID=622674 RepID=UPI003D2491F9